jgi:DNA-binding NtrC family response regulator
MNSPPLSAFASVRVFVVDDERLIAETLAEILGTRGFMATAFHDPEQAIEAAKRYPVHLLISDVVMPKLSGVDLAITIKALHPDCKILLFSGQAQTSNLLQTASEHGHNFKLLAKPMHPQDLLREIGKQDTKWAC